MERGFTILHFWESDDLMNVNDGITVDLSNYMQIATLNYMITRESKHYTISI